MKVKSIELTRSQIKALENGATMLMFPIDTNGKKMSEIGLKKDLLDFSPLQVDDEYIFVKEEFYTDNDGNVYYNTDKTTGEIDYMNMEYDYHNASEMTQKQSRFSLDCIDARVVRVQDMSIADMYNSLGADYKFTSEEMLINNFVEGCHTQLKEQNINRTYEDNDYVFLVEIKDGKDEL